MEKRFTIQDINALRDFAEKGDVRGYWQYQKDKGSALALQLHFSLISESMGSHASEVMDDERID